MRPNDKNRIVCPDCGKPKMQFESERKALDFIKWNAEDFPQGGESLRAYYCKACCCWHISHKHYSSGYGRQFENKVSSFRQQRGNSGKRLDKLIRSADLEPIMHQAQEIYSRLNLSNTPRKAITSILRVFLKEHNEYQESSTLRNEIFHIYDLENRKKK